MRHRARPPATTFLLPPWLRIRWLPGAVPVALGLFLLLIALVKIPMMSAKCGPDPWGSANAIMVLVEMVCGVMLLRPQLGRRLAALFWAALMPWVAVFLVYMHHRGYDVEGCGCFGPVELGLTAHLAVIGILCAVAGAVFLREETRELDRVYGPEAGDPRALRRLVRPFE